MPASSFTRATTRPDLPPKRAEACVWPWDKPDVEVVIEKRGRDKHDVVQMDVPVEQQGNHVQVSVTQPKRDHVLNFNSCSAKLIVSLPASSEVTAKSGDGSTTVRRSRSSNQESVI